MTHDMWGVILPYGGRWLCFIGFWGTPKIVARSKIAKPWQWFVCVFFLMSLRCTLHFSFLLKHFGECMKVVYMSFWSNNYCFSETAMKHKCLKYEPCPLFWRRASPGPPNEKPSIISEFVLTKIRKGEVIKSFYSVESSGNINFSIFTQTSGKKLAN